MMTDEIGMEELRIRASLEKMDDAFRVAMLKAIAAGEELAPTAISKKPCTRRPIFVFT
jgi:hypothetical protein